MNENMQQNSEAPHPLECSPKTMPWIITIAIVAILGFGSGYWIGFVKADGLTSPADTLRIPSATSDLMMEEEDENPFAEVKTNPFENATTNPLDDINVNPYENVKFNPFE